VPICFVPPDCASFTFSRLRRTSDLKSFPFQYTNAKKLGTARPQLSPQERSFAEAERQDQPNPLFFQVGFKFSYAQIFYRVPRPLRHFRYEDFCRGFAVFEIAIINNRGRD